MALVEAGPTKSFRPSITGGELACFGPYTYRSTTLGGRPVQLEVIIESPGPAICNLDIARPRTRDLRVGVQGSLDGNTLRVQRNRPQWRRRARRISVSTEGLRYEIACDGRALRVVDANGQVAWESFPSTRIASDLTPREAALVIALLIADVPDSTSIVRGVLQSI